MCNNQWLREVEVAKMLGVSQSKLRNDRCQRRGLPYHKVDHTIRYSLTDILEYMEKKRIDPREQ